MAKISFEMAEQFVDGTFGGYFNLENHGDNALIRIMLESPNQLESFTGHEVEIDGKKVFVNCLRETPETPVEECPLCAAKKKTALRVYIPVFVVATNEVKVWQRGKNFLPQLRELFAKSKKLVNSQIEVVREGQKGDYNTKYHTTIMETDKTLLSDLPDIPQIEGILIHDKDIFEMQEILNPTNFVARRNTSQEEPVKRNTPRTTAEIIAEVSEPEPIEPEPVKQVSKRGKKTKVNVETPVEEKEDVALETAVVETPVVEVVTKRTGRSPRKAPTNEF
jgi:hypothetical protein